VAAIFDVTLERRLRDLQLLARARPASNGSVYSGGVPASITVEGSNDPSFEWHLSHYENGLTTPPIGDICGFFVNPIDSMGGAASLTISQLRPNPRFPSRPTSV
jgi:hypothetical protein